MADTEVVASTKSDVDADAKMQDAKMEDADAKPQVDRESNGKSGGGEVDASKKPTEDEDDVEAVRDTTTRAPDVESTDATRITGACGDEEAISGRRGAAFTIERRRR